MEVIRVTLFLVILIYDVTQVSADCSNVTAVSARLDALLAEYDRAVRPGDVTDDVTGPTVVRLALDVRHASVDEATSTVRLIADLRMSWRDTRLAWNASEWGCDVTLVAAERLWLPDVELVSAGATSSAGTGGSTSEEPRARLEAGTVRWARRLDVRVPTPLALQDWPHDTQRAVFKFASRQYASDELDLAIMDQKYATVFESGTWEAASLSAGAVSLEWTAEESGRRVAAWALSLRRRAAGGAAAAAAVLGAAALLLLGAALTAPARRAPVAAAASLTAAVWLMSVAPRVGRGQSAPHAVSAAGAATAIGAALAAWSALVARLARRTQPPPHRLRRLLTSVSHYCSLTMDEEEHGDGGAGAGAGAWRAAAALLDRALLATSALTLLVFYCLCL